LGKRRADTHAKILSNSGFRNTRLPTRYDQPESAGNVLLFGGRASHLDLRGARISRSPDPQPVRCLLCAWAHILQTPLVRIYRVGRAEIVTNERSRTAILDN